MDLNNSETLKLPHHVQQSLCETRPSYRQGRKLTAIKVYTVNDESKHLLVFGVPSLKLRQEIKQLLIKFGKLKQCAVTDDYPNELFTETYHVIYERIQSARIAKRMVDTKNFYGGLLHICYAPELETEEEVREKLLLRKKEVLRRLKNHEQDSTVEERNSKEPTGSTEYHNSPKVTVNMSEVNYIRLNNANKHINKNALKRAYDDDDVVTASDSKSCFIEKAFQPNHSYEFSDNNNTIGELQTAGSVVNNCDTNNIDPQETLNFNEFGKEVIKHYEKPVNRIKFFVKNKKS